MEKISIARRHLERQGSFLAVKNETIIKPETIIGNKPAPIMCSGVENDEMAAAVNAYPSGFLNSFFKKGSEIGLTDKRQFTVEIISGLEKPIKLLVSVQPEHKDSGNKKFLTTREAACFFKVSKNTIYRQLKQGRLSGLKIGRNWRIWI